MLPRILSDLLQNGLGIDDDSLFHGLGDGVLEVCRRYARLAQSVFRSNKVARWGHGHQNLFDIKTVHGTALDHRCDHGFPVPVPGNVHRMVPFDSAWTS